MLYVQTNFIIDLLYKKKYKNIKIIFKKKKFERKLYLKLKIINKNKKYISTQIKL